MIPLTLHMKNFLSYRGETPAFDFSAIHIACLSGDNGAGKSSFLEAIHWAIWGEARLSEREIITTGEQDMFVALTFMVNNISYRIHRSFNTNRGSAGGSKLLLEQASDAQPTKWASLNGGTIRETQQRITNNIIGMSYAVFQNSAYLRQGRADAFTQLAPGERREILAQILEIDQYEKYREHTKIARSKLNDEKNVLQGEINHDTLKVTEIPDLELNLDKADSTLATAETYGKYADACIALQNAQKILTNTQAQFDSTTTIQQELLVNIAQLTHQLTQRPAIESQYQQLIAYEQTARQLASQRTQFDTLQSQREAAQKQIYDAKQLLVQHIHRLTAEIQTIDGVVGNYDNLVREHAQLVTHVDTLHDVDSQIIALKQQQQQLRTTLDMQQMQLHRQATLTTELQKLHNRIDQLAEATQQWDTLNTQLVACDAAQRRVDTIQSELMTLQTKKAALSTQRDDVKTRGQDRTNKQKNLAIDQPCPTCHTMMDHEHHTQAVAEFEREIVFLRSQFSEFRDQISQINQQITTLDAQKTDCEQQTVRAGEIRRRIGGIEAQRDEIVRLQTQLGQSQQQLDTLSALDLAVTIQATQQQLSDSNEALQSAKNQQSKRDLEQQRIDQLHNDISQLTTQKHRRGDCVIACDAAQLQLDTHQYAPLQQQTHTQLTAALTTLNYDPHALPSIQTQIDTLLPIRDQYNQLALNQANLGNAQLRLSETTTRLDELTTTRDTSVTAIHEYTVVRSALEPHIGTNNTQQTPQQMRNDADNAIRYRREHRSTLLGKLSDARTAQNKLIIDQARLATLANEINRYDVLEKAFASKGIQAMLIREYAIPALEYETNQILARMSDNQLYLDISTKTETQRGNTVETIDLRVSDASGTRPIEAYSGGEAFRISFALRIALSKLLTHRAGHRLETLIIDEGFGTQDAQGRERLVEAINSISADFHTILVITHVQELRDLFPTQITFTRTMAGSKWEMVA